MLTNKKKWWNIKETQYYFFICGIDLVLKNKNRLFNVFKKMHEFKQKNEKAENVSILYINCYH